MDINTALAHMTVATRRSMRLIRIDNNKYTWQLEKLVLTSEDELVALQTLLNCESLDYNGSTLQKMYDYVTALLYIRYPVPSPSYDAIQRICNDFWYGFSVFTAKVF